jgi:hypothetical protein
MTKKKKKKELKRLRLEMSFLVHKPNDTKKKIKKIKSIIFYFVLISDGPNGKWNPICCQPTRRMED